MFAVWFECKTCRGSFLELSHFLVHKKQDHFDEFQTTECIIFEERRIQNYETLTVSFSPTPQEIEDTHFHEFIDPQIIKIESENFKDSTNSEFQSHTDPNLAFLEIDYPIRSDQDFQNKVDDFISSKNGASATHSNVSEKPAVSTSSIPDNSTATDVTSLNRDSCENSKTILDLENKADASINVNSNAFNSSDSDSTQFFIKSPKDPFVLVKRLTGQDIQRWSVIDSKKPKSGKYTEKPGSFHSKGTCSTKNLNNLFECKLCLDKFNTDLELTVHANSCLLSHSNRTPFYCSPCNKIFSTSASLNKHVIRNHPAELKTVNSKKLKICHLCSKMFLYEYDLKRHTLTHSKKNKIQKPTSRPFKSQRCGASIINKYKLSQHPTRHAAKKTINKQSIDRTYPKISKTKINDNDSLRLTISVVTSGSQIFSCDKPHCGKSFRVKYDFKRHMATHSHARPFKCPKPNCEKAFKRKDHVREHTINVHSDFGLCKRPQVNCEKITTKNCSLSKLATSHLYKEPFRCPISSCPQKFKHKGSIRFHMAQHSGLRQFKCPNVDCKKTFQLRHHLTNHLRTHSEAKPLKSLKASCQKTFKTSDGILNHMKLRPDPHLKKCPEVGCKKMFKSKKGLREHLLTHQYLKPLKCSETKTDDVTNANSQGTQSAIKVCSGPYKCKHPNCGKQFALRCKLKRHEATHSEERPFKCPEPSCLKAIRKKNNFTMHVRAHAAKSKLGRKNDFKTHKQTTDDASSKRTTQDQDAFSTDFISFKCNKLHCGKQFSNKFNLKRHSFTVHSGKRPIKCPVATCNFTCTRKNHLKTHLLTKKHTDIQNSVPN